MEFFSILDICFKYEEKLPKNGVKTANIAVNTLTLNRFKVFNYNLESNVANNFHHILVTFVTYLILTSINFQAKN